MVKLRRQRSPPGHLLDDVIADDVMTRLRAGSNDDDDNDTADDFDEHFRDAVYRSVKRSNLTDSRRRPRAQSFLCRPSSADPRPRAEAVVYRPTTAPQTETDYRHAGCALCGDTSKTKWTSCDVDDRPDLIDICHRPQCYQQTPSINCAHCRFATVH